MSFRSKEETGSLFGDNCRVLEVLILRRSRITFSSSFPSSSFLLHLHIRRKMKSNKGREELELLAVHKSKIEEPFIREVIEAK